jgi:hypothetical protein
MSYGSDKIVALAELAIAEAHLKYATWNVESLKEMYDTTSDKELREAERDLVIAEQHVVIAKQHVKDVR